MSDVGISAVMQGMSVAEKVTGNVGVNMANAGTPGFQGIVSQLYSNVVGVGEKNKMDLNSGEITSTDKEFDYGLNGNGFFTLDCNNERKFTAAGSFTTDKNGYLVTPGDCKLLGEKYADGATKPIKNLEGDFVPIRVNYDDYTKVIASAKVDVNDLKLSATQMPVGGGNAEITLPTVDGNYFTLEFDYTNDASKIVAQTYKFIKDSTDSFDLANRTVQYSDLNNLIETIKNSPIRSFLSENPSPHSGKLKLDLNNTVRMKFDAGASKAQADNLEGGVTNIGFVKSEYDPYNKDGNMAGGYYTPDFSRSFKIIDSKGIKHAAEMLFKKIGSDKYSVEIVASANQLNIQTGSAGYTRTDGLIAAGTMNFGIDGNFNNFEQIPSPSLYPQGGATDLANSTDITFPWNADISGAPTKVSLSFKKAILSGTAYAGDVEADGQDEAAIVNTSVDKHGNLIGQYSNGDSKYLYAIPIANFKDAAALESGYGTVLSETADSGKASFEIAGEEGAATIVGRSLNSSNVDITGQMTNLIENQRWYSFCAKAYGHMLRMENVLLDVV